jgi:hypothetical protein
MEKRTAGRVEFVRAPESNPIASMSDVSTRQLTVENKSDIISNTDSNDKIVTAALLFFLALNASLIALDFWSHPDQGVANLERRKFLVETFSPFFKYIGNYGISAVLVIVAGLTKNLLENVSSNKITKNMIKHGYLLAVAGTLALNGLAEDFSRNNEKFEDFSVGAWAILNSAILVELLAAYAQQKNAKGQQVDVA